METLSYEQQQQKLLRKTKKHIYRILEARGYETTQAALSMKARQFGGLYYVSPAVQHRSIEIVSKLYDPVPIPMASTPTDLYNQNNLVCTVLLSLQSFSGPSDKDSTPPLFIGITNDPTYRTEIQHLVYSRLLEQLERLRPPIERTTDYESLYNLITDLRDRLERVERRLEMENHDNPTDG